MRLRASRLAAIIAAAATVTRPKSRLISGTDISYMYSKFLLAVLRLLTLNPKYSVTCVSETIAGSQVQTFNQYVKDLYMDSLFDDSYLQLPHDDKLSFWFC